MINTNFMFLFSKKSIGLDIADHTIEAVELVKKGTAIRVLSVGRVKLRPGVVERGKIKDEEKLMQAVREVFLKAKPHVIVAEKVIFGLPESQIYTHTFSLTSKDGKFQESEIGALVLKEAQKSIPLKEDDLIYSYKELKRSHTTDSNGKEKIEVLLVAASKEVVLEWQKFFQRLKIEAEAFDMEMLAIRRALLREFVSKNSSVMIIDIGAVTSNIAIFDKDGSLRYSHSIPVAGDAMTNEIVSAMKMKADEAEKLKIKMGVAKPEERVSAVLIKVLESILKEIKIALKYFKKNTSEEVKEIILVGGSSQLKGLADYFKANLDLAVRIGQPAVSIKTQEQKNKKTISDINIPDNRQRTTVNDQLFYLEAIGLALRGLEKKWVQRDPVLVIKTKKHKNIKTKDDEKVEVKLVQDISHKEQLHEEASLVSVSEIEHAKRLRFQKILLAGILIIGIVIIGLAFLYRSSEKAKKAEQLESEIIQYSQTQSFDLKVPIASNTAEYTNDRVRGRVIENTIQLVGDYNEAVANSRIIVEKELKEGEVLWLEPISPPRPSSGQAEQAIFPMIIKWLVYSDEGANKLLIKEVEKLNEYNVDYVLSNIEKTSVEATDNSNIFSLTGKVTIALNELIEIIKTTGKEEEQSEVANPKSEIIILNTPTGWLNVREGPGTNYSKITRVYPGEIYPQLEESSGWYKIKLGEESVGWITSQYAKK